MDTNHYKDILALAEKMLKSSVMCGSTLGKCILTMEKCGYTLFMSKEK